MAHVSNHYSDEGAPYGAYDVPSTPVSALGFNFLFAPLEEAFGWRGAARFTMTAVVLLWAAGALALIRTLHPARVPLAAFGALLGFQWALYMGFFFFVLASALGLLTVALALGSKVWTWRRRVAIAALLTSLALLHVFATLTSSLTCNLASCTCRLCSIRKQDCRSTGEPPTMGSTTLC